MNSSTRLKIIREGVHLMNVVVEIFYGMVEVPQKRLSTKRTLMCMVWKVPGSKGCCLARGF
jgi:hypothetical protein